ncbi:MAG TPA: hypothetical protein VFV38_48810 [Ktedonobacteraceae bacterium]|nr:hypothetical protein [Ktedonobacteraceae bacterium]
MQDMNTDRDSDYVGRASYEGTTNFETPTYIPIHNPYSVNPYLPDVKAPRPPRNAGKIMAYVGLSLVGLLLISFVVYVGLMGKAPWQSTQGNRNNQSPSTSHIAANSPTSSISSPTSTIVIPVTPTSQPTTSPGTFSKTPIVEQIQFEGYWEWFCYVTDNSKDSAGLFGWFQNQNESTLLQDCIDFLGQGDYYSTGPLHAVSGDTEQCQGWGADNTFWKIEATQPGEEVSIFCGSAENVVPGVQG